MSEKNLENQEAGAAEQTADARTTLTVRDKEDAEFLEGMARTIEPAVQQFLNPKEHAEFQKIEFYFEAHRDTTYRCTILSPQHIHITPVDRIRIEGPSFTSNDGILYPPKNAVK